MNDVNNCRIIEELLSPFFDEELNEEADALVRRHLDSCAACSAKLDEIKETVMAINALPVEAAPEGDLWPGIVAGSGTDPGVTRLRARRKRRFRFQGLLPLAATLTALMVPAVAVLAGIRLFGNDAEPSVAPAPDVRLELPVDIRIRQRGEASPTLDALLAALEDQDGEVRKTAAQALGEFDDERAVAVLVRALRDEDAQVRRWAAWALGEIDDGDAVEGLVAALLADPVGEVRRWAAWALGEIEEESAVPALSETVTRDSWAEARRWAAWALGEIQEPAAVPALSQAVVNDTNAEVRRWAAWALGEIGDPSAAEALTRAMKDESAEVRRWAIRALGEMN